MTTREIDHQVLVSVLQTATEGLQLLLGGFDDEDQEDIEGFTLTPREAAILCNLFLYRRKTEDRQKIREELGAHFGVSKERIRQLESKLRTRIANYNARNGVYTSHDTEGWV